MNSSTKECGIEQFVDALAGGEFAFGALLGGRLGVGVEGDLLSARRAFFQDLLWICAMICSC